MRPYESPVVCRRAASRRHRGSANRRRVGRGSPQGDGAVPGPTSSSVLPHPGLSSTTRSRRQHHVLPHRVDCLQTRGSPSGSTGGATTRCPTVQSSVARRSRARSRPISFTSTVPSTTSGWSSRACGCLPSSLCRAWRLSCNDSPWVRWTSPASCARFPLATSSLAPGLCTPTGRCALAPTWRDASWPRATTSWVARSGTGRVLRMLQPQARYYEVGEVLGEPFYQMKWSGPPTGDGDAVLHRRGLGAQGRRDSSRGPDPAAAVWRAEASAEAGGKGC